MKHMALMSVVAISILSLSEMASANTCNAGHGCTRDCGDKGAICIWDEPNGPCHTECTPPDRANMRSINSSGVSLDDIRKQLKGQ